MIPFGLEEERPSASFTNYLSEQTRLLASASFISYEFDTEELLSVNPNVIFNLKQAYVTPESRPEVDDPVYVSNQCHISDHSYSSPALPTEVPVIKEEPAQVKRFKTTKPRNKVSSKKKGRLSDVLNPMIMEEMVDTETLRQPQGKKSAPAGSRFVAARKVKCGRPRKIITTDAISTIPELPVIGNSEYVNRKAKAVAMQNIAKKKPTKKKVASRKNTTLHNEKEKARRNAMKDMFNLLKSLVPPSMFQDESGKLKKLISKNLTLIGARKYIELLEQQGELKQKMRILKAKLHKLLRQCKQRMV